MDRMWRASQREGAHGAEIALYQTAPAGAAREVLRFRAPLWAFSRSVEATPSFFVAAHRSKWARRPGAETCFRVWLPTAALMRLAEDAETTLDWIDDRDAGLRPRTGRLAPLVTLAGAAAEAFAAAAVEIEDATPELRMLAASDETGRAVVAAAVMEAEAALAI